jgi:uncharacterized protein YprB with RNaseH-like and TPR domain
MSAPRIAFIDIETAPIIAAVWQLYDTNVVWVERDTHLLSFAVKWSDKKTIKTHALPDYRGYSKNRYDDKRLARDMWEVVNEADFIVAHNGDEFDLKKANARFIVHGLTPPAPYKSIDTLKISRRNFKFDSNKLDNIARQLGVGRKLPHTGADLWRRCLDGDPDAWNTMRRYNAHDVALLDGVYHKIRSWDARHPDLNHYTRAGACPTCQSMNIQRGRGWNVSRAGKKERLRCLDCNKWFQDDRLIREAA